jgi:hypothetical protein
MATYEEAVNDLQENYKYALCSAIIDSSSNILYSTDNWDISNDIKKIMAAWRSGSARFVKISTWDMKFSVLQTDIVRFISTNFGKKGHLIGAATPDQSYYMVAFIGPEAEDWMHGAFPSIARAVAMLVGASSGADVVKIEIVPKSDTSGSSIDPQLKENLEGFLKWIKDPQGLSGYISYYIEQNDMTIISKLAAIYNEFRRIFNF